MPSPVHPYSDYGVALRTLRSARGWLGLLLFLCVVTQFVGFGLMYYTQQPYEGSKPERRVLVWDVAKERFQKWLYERALASTTEPSTQAAGAAVPEDFFPGTAESHKLNIRKQWDTTYVLVVPVTQLLGLMAVGSQTIIVFLTLLVILVAQAPGVAQVTRSLIWTCMLLFIVLPWQSFFQQGFPIPGILYGYDEMLRFIGPVMVGEHVTRFARFLIVARFWIWPLVAMLVLLITAERFRAGIMLAIGHPLQSMMVPRAGATIGAGAMGAGGAVKGK